MKKLLFITVFVILSLSNGFTQSFSPKEQLQIDSILAVINNKSFADTTRIDARVEFGERTMLFRVSYWDSIANTCETILKTKPPKKIKEKLQKSLAHSLNNVGYVYKQKGEIDDAIKYYNKSLGIHRIIADSIGIATGLNNLGIIYNSFGEIAKALDYYHESLKIREKMSDKRGVSNSLNNIGYIYHGQWDTLKALEYYTKSMVIREEIGDKRGIAESLNNIGTVYEDYKNYIGALEYYNKSLKICEKIANNRGISLALSNIAYVYRKQGNLKEAIDFYLKALAIREENNQIQAVAKSLTSIGGVYLDIDKLNEALIHAKRALSISETLGFPEEIRNAAEILSRIYEKQGKGMQALEMHKLYVSMRDSINNEETIKISAKQQAKYEYEKQKTIDDAEHEKQLAIDHEAKAKQRVITYSIAIGLVLVVLFLIFVFNRLQVTKKQKLVIENQKTVVEKAHYELEEKNKEITDSIQYAKRIQNAILPPSKLVKEYLPQSFILYKPKDIVAGDFYWMEHKNGKILFAAADCTGHGVPGAMVSVVCNNGLNRSVREHGLTEPGKILDKTREIVIQEFEKSDEEVKDGMDISLCELDTKNNTLAWSGANNSLWIIRNNEILEYKADKQPIGKYAESRPFSTHIIELQKEDSIYIFTDGYQDQFGGEKGKKFKIAKLRELLLSIQHEEMENQREIINTAFENWKGNLEQVDDVCVIGVRI